MIEKQYRKTTTIMALRFNEDEWKEKYDRCDSSAEWDAVSKPYGIDRWCGHFVIATIEGDIILHDGDWITTGASGEH